MSTTALRIVTDTAMGQSRARYPDEEGFVERDGVRLFYEVYGSGEPTVLLLPTWSIVHSRHWKMQVPYLARHCRVLTFDGRGNGRSDRPSDPRAYAEAEFAADALAVMDTTGTDSAILVSFSLGSQRALLLAAEHPERVEAAVFIGPSYPGGGEPLPERTVYSWEDELDTDDGWANYNKHVWLQDYRGFLEFFISRFFTEPHSTKPFEDCVGWGLDTTGETLVTAQDGAKLESEEARELAGRLRCPVLVIHGGDDAIISVTRGLALAEHTSDDVVVLEGSGHAPHVRDPVKVNLLLRDFACPPRPAASWPRGRVRRKRALYISSPIGLGHAQRDVAIADELRRLHPDLEIDWLAQHPVTAVLEARGERIHPASAFLASESQHIEGESAEHDLHCFQAIRRMDEILGVFVGNPEDIVPERFAAHLPWIREWTEAHFSFAGYVTGFDPAQFADRAALRAELGYAPDEQLCIVTVGGSGVGGNLLRRVVSAFPEAKERVPALRMIVVAGPRIDPQTLPTHEGLEVRAYPHELYRHLAACDLAVVQGGLTTSMELTANRRPFLYFPLRHHFEQNFHVRHRLSATAPAAAWTSSARRRRRSPP
jgi:pimeloyl-ACP methyl ester carboxylesterase